MRRIIRLIKEFLFSITNFKDPLPYFRERLGKSQGDNIELQMRNGISYMLHANTNEIRMISEVWNEEVYDRLFSYIQDHATVIDIGANIGIFSLKAASYAKGVRVFGYEPFPQSFVALQENIALNKLQDFIFPINKAVVGGRGERELFYRPHDSGGVSLQQYGDVGELSSVQVKGITLKDVFDENNIEQCDYMKVDCEGAEEEIFLNAPRELFQRIRSITFEWHDALNNISLEQFCDFLENVGYATKYDANTQVLYAWHAHR